MDLHLPSTTIATYNHSQDDSRDKKDALLQRLNGLVSHLSGDSARIYDETLVAAINLEVDHIETLMKGEENNSEFEVAGTGLKDSQMLAKSKDDDDDDGDSIRSLPTSIPKSQADIQSASANDIAKAAEELASQLATSIEELQTRRTESGHIHGLLITRVEKATERIIYLESEISQMEDDFSATQSEIRFLRIQLQAIEAQCSQYIPYEEEDEELSQSILNWKVDWEDIEKRSNARRLKRSELLANVHASHAVV